MWHTCYTALPNRRAGLGYFLVEDRHAVALQLLETEVRAGRWPLRSTSWRRRTLSRHTYHTVGNQLEPRWSIQPRVDVRVEITSHMEDHDGVTRRSGKWRAKRDSNPQPAVLETAALPIELLTQE